MAGGAAARHQDLAADICLGLTVWNRLLTGSASRTRP